MRHLFWIGILLWILSPTGARSQAEPLVSDRPDFTESAVTISPGRVQFEGGFTRTEVGSTRATEIGELLIRYGLAENTELRLGIGSLVEASDTGFSTWGWNDAEVGVKQRLVHGDGAIPELAILGGISLPFGTKDISNDKVQPALLGAAQWELSNRIGLGANLGWAYNYDRLEEESFSQLWASAALGFAAGRGWGLFIEGYGFNQQEFDSRSTGYVDFGVTLQTDEDFQLDLRYGKGFNGLDTDWYGGAGFVWRI